MELPSVGEHCALSSCSKLDFLPTKCNWCLKIFCGEHKRCEDHNCTVSNSKKGEDTVNENISENSNKQVKKVFDHVCSYTGCKRKESVGSICMCRTCHKEYCIKHRMESTHKCPGKPPPEKHPLVAQFSSSASNITNTVSENKKPQSHTNSDINRPNLTSSHETTTSSFRHHPIAQPTVNGASVNTKVTKSQEQADLQNSTPRQIYELPKISHKLLSPLIYD